ncbi:hypothetical protein [Aeromonas rivipollensis]|uniref:hypothetical protein n=1 Tax=Aeromonas rivipollensis TaxID=948519 RepID=UPI0038CFFAFC
MIDLMHKNIILFCPSFFDYDKAIKKEFESIGAAVHLYDERPFKSIIGRAILRLNMSWIISWCIKMYYYRLLLPRINDVDYLVFINPESISSNILDKIREINPEINIVVYMWDSFKNKPAAKKLLDSVDCFFTFDPDDAATYNICFLPLFYVSEYAESRHIKSGKYRLSFIGTAHTERYKIVKNIMGAGDRVFLFLFTPSRVVFLYKKYICGELGDLNFTDVSSMPMLREDVVTIVADSEAVIDINHPGQVGLTMRTLEVLGAGRKLVTTNKNIVNYDFYNENNILIIRDKINKDVITEFLDKPYVKLSDKIYEKYSLSNWVEQLFTGDLSRGYQSKT